MPSSLVSDSRFWLVDVGRSCASWLGSPASESMAETALPHLLVRRRNLVEGLYQFPLGKRNLQLLASPADAAPLRECAAAARLHHSPACGKLSVLIDWESFRIVSEGLGGLFRKASRKGDQLGSALGSSQGSRPSQAALCNLLLRIVSCASALGTGRFSFGGLGREGQLPG